MLSFRNYTIICLDYDTLRNNVAHSYIWKNETSDNEIMVGHMYPVEVKEGDLRKARNLSIFLFTGAIIQIIGIVTTLWILSSGGAFQSSGGTGINLGAPFTFTLFGIMNLTLIAAAVLIYLRVSYLSASILLFISILTALPIGTIFVVIGIFKLQKARNAFPGQLEEVTRKAEAKKKIKKDHPKGRLDLECPQCGKDFAVKDSGKRPLPIKCPHCGVEGEI